MIYIITLFILILNKTYNIYILLIINAAIF